MKRTTFFNLFILGFVLVFGITGCKKKPVGITPIHGSRVGVGNSGQSGLMDNSGVIPFNANPDGTGSIEAVSNEGIEGLPRNYDMFAANTVHFDLDSATVKSSEASNVETVANYFKSNAAAHLVVEGHCDERGTEGYNVTLGDKRANALREYLVNLGVSPERIHTISYGETQPVDPGQSESAWAKNRRGVFALVEPAK